MTPRQKQVLELLRQHGDTSVQELARVLKVTSQTIRKDVRSLEDAELVARYHGGVGLPSTVENIDYSQRLVMNVDAKRRIARLVAQQVESGRSLILNIGTTTEEVARALAQHRGIRVVTNNLNVAAILAANEQAEVFIAGGLVRHRDHGIVGEATLDFMRQFKVDVGVIGVSSIETDGTLLDYDYREVRIAQAIMEQSREVWLVADHSKYTRSAMVRLGHFADVDRFFTDAAVPPALAQVLEAAQVQVFVAAGAEEDRRDGPGPRG
ncbi:MAG TPA: DeoR/GlpR family DNA-binding transcription regulator [Anaeromyxobacter sp.]|nr:DeoR/GlpR family DNA-binding transcription regulator [Anaeromyxobacter sp.]HVO21625.1 DeoR/GlpR family DNA-binding transcription regulator [Anaeromyxobacter sp.]